MALSDAEIAMLSINLRKTIKGFFLEKKQAGEPGYNLEMNDSTLATMLLTSHRESLDDKSPDGYWVIALIDHLFAFDLTQSIAFDLTTRLHST
jgi:hypothetical protein